MKKIIIIILLLQLFLLPIGVVYGETRNENDTIQSVKDKSVNYTFVSEVGMNQDQELELLGYNITKNPVNWNECGEYIVTYEHKLSKKSYLRKVVLLSPEELKEKGYTSLKETRVLEATKEYSSDVSITLPTGELCIIQCEAKEVEPLYYFTSKLLIFKENKLLVNTTIFEDKLAHVSKIVYDETTCHLFLIGEMSTKDTSYDVTLWEYRMNGEKVNEVTYSGNDIDYANAIHVTKNNIFIGGKTKSTNGVFTDFTHEDINHFDGYLLKIHKDTLGLDKAVSLGLNKEDDVAFLSENNGELIVIQKYIKNPNIAPSMGYQIRFYDYELGHIKDIIIGSFNDYQIFNTFIDEECFCIYGGYPGKKKYFLYRLNHSYELEMSMLYENKDEDIVNLSYMDSSLEEGVLRILYNTTNKNNNIGILYHVRTEEKLLNEMVVNDTAQKLYLSNQMNFVDCRNDGIYFKSNLTGQVVSKGKTSVDSKESNYNDYEVYINDQVATHHYKLSETVVDNTMFGTYPVHYVFLEEGIELHLYKDVLVESEISVIDQRSYDIDTNISFVGKGELDGKNISSGYKCNELGSHVLKVVGKDETKVVSFDIEKKRVTKEIEPEFDIGDIVSESNKDLKDIQIENDTLVQEDKVKKSENLLWTLSFPFLLFSFTIYEIFRRKRV